MKLSRFYKIYRLRIGRKKILKFYFLKDMYICVCLN